MAKFYRGEIVRVLRERPGSINEFARVEAVYGGSKFWICNLNQPFSGSITGIFMGSELAHVEKADAKPTDYNENFLTGY